MLSPTVTRRIALGWRIALVVAGIFATALLTGEEMDYFSPWDRSTRFWIVVVVAAVTAVDNILAGFRTIQAAKRSQAEARVQKVLTVLLVQISEASGVQIQDLGASVFVPRIRRVGWLPKKVLVRALRFRLDEHPQPSPVKWTKGKGAVGTCWETARTVHRDWHVQRTQYSDPALAAQDFAGIPAELRDGFGHKEFVAISDKYSEVLAVPVLSVEGSIVGVVSIDVAGRAGLAANILDTDEVKAQADVAVTLVRDDLDQLYAQS